MRFVANFILKPCIGTHRPLPTPKKRMWNNFTSLENTNFAKIYTCLCTILRSF